MCPLFRLQKAKDEYLRRGFQCVYCLDDLQDRFQALRCFDIKQSLMCGKFEMRTYSTHDLSAGHTVVKIMSKHQWAKFK